MDAIKIPVVELFGNTIQGEGALVGTPAVFVRVFGCNLNCRGFGMPKGELSNEADEIIASPEFAAAKELKDLPLAKTGCDSYPAIMPQCMRFCKMYTPDEMADEILKASGFKPRLVVFTGGEPLLRQRDLATVISILYNTFSFREFMFETNGTVGWEQHWLTENMPDDLHIWFSISPKLSTSGNPRDKAINRDAVHSLLETCPARTYLKFVADENTPVDEIVKTAAHFQFGTVYTLPVYLMPEGGVLDERSRKNAQYVADLCWKLGYRFSPREHLTVYGNAWAK